MVQSNCCCNKTVVAIKFLSQSNCCNQTVANQPEKLSPYNICFNLRSSRYRSATLLEKISTRKMYQTLVTKVLKNTTKYYKLLYSGCLPWKFSIIFLSQLLCFWGERFGTWYPPYPNTLFNRNNKINLCIINSELSVTDIELF